MSKQTVKRHDFMRTHESMGGPGLTACIAGMQSDGGYQFASVANHLPGRVRAYNAVGPHFHPDHLVDRIAADVQEFTDRGEPVRIVGASMGGMLTPFVTDELRQRNPDLDASLLKAVIIDAPSGAESLVNNKAYLLNNHLAAKAIAAIPECAPAPYVLPKWDEITIPENLITSPDNYRYQVREAAKSRMAGFTLSLVAEELHWMIRSGFNGSLARACRSLDDVDTTYVVCDVNNYQVKPSVALPAWGNWVRNLQPMWVDATHCGFHQDNPQFVELFREIFDEEQAV